MTRKDRIDQIKKELEALSNGPVTFGAAKDMPEEAQEKFLLDVLAFHKAPTTTGFEQLGRAGVALPAPDQVPDTDMHSTLWTVINALATAGTYLKSTDHLSDRQLYELLWTDILREEYQLLPETSQGAWVFDLAEGDLTRQQEHRRHERDRLLPVPPYEIEDTRH